ncbi:DUF3566 domain-containing protein [Actinomadura flavalba]|uniref:DUF3566 domain-containing protein n=1 Tax=Actinomadura flavalba TaxID=1120938 RepID=UPI000360FBDD|nr:DUF3566 domain-containing protein [Actinomadura flavalba]
MSTQPGDDKGRTGEPAEESGEHAVVPGAGPDGDAAPVASDDDAPDKPAAADDDPPAPSSVEDTVIDRPAVPIAPVADEPAPSWTTPAEPADSLSNRRTDTPVRAEAGGGPRESSGRSGFAATAVKDRPSPPPSATAAGGTVSAAAGNGASARPGGGGKPARKAQLQLARLEPWSVMKFSFVMSLVCFVVLLVAVTVLYIILAGLGVFDAIGDTVNSLTRNEAGDGVDAGNWFSFARIFGYTAIVGALNVVLITSLATVGSVIYNLVAEIVGGVEVTLKEAE